jgi:benzodiazapine receptor
MKKNKWGSYAYWIVLSEAIGALSGYLTKGGMREYEKSAAKPPLTPPGTVFPIVWGALFLLMGVGAARVSQSERGPDRTKALALDYVQLAVNFSWSLVFFNLQSYEFAFWMLLGLWLLILWMTLSFTRCDKAAGLLQIPYLLWTAFAAYLSGGVWLLNR